MSKQVDLSKPLSDEDREYLKSRADHYTIEENDRVHKKGKFAEDYEEEFKPNYTVAAPPIEPGSDADTPPVFVGQRPYGVDRAVWGGSTGLEKPDDADLDHSPSSTEDESKFRNTPALANPESTTAANDAEELEEQSDVEDLSVDELKEELRSRGLPVSGNKAELQERLNEALEKE